MNLRDVYTDDHIRLKKRLLYVLILCLMLSGCKTGFVTSRIINAISR